MAVYALSIHADYRCRHSGACCSTDWDVPVELAVYRTLEEAVQAGRVTPAGGAGGPAFVTEPDLPEGAAAVFARTAVGDCVFLDRGARRCRIHRDLGEWALPASCRHFPRVALRDGRGTFVTLSHYCPTAAGLLFRDDVALAIVEAPPAFPDADYGGLRVASDAWPPLLHPRMLMDGDGYAAWERHMVSRCAQLTPPESIVATLRRDALQLRAWTPADGPLADAVAALPALPVPARPPGGLADSLRLRAEAVAAAPDDLPPAIDGRDLDETYRSCVRPRWEDFAAPLGRYLAARAFASWVAYQGRGLLTIVRALETAAAVVRVESARLCRDAGRPLDRHLLAEGFRAGDYLLTHLASAEDLAAAWSRAERAVAAGPS